LTRRANGISSPPIAGLLRLPSTNSQHSLSSTVQRTAYLSLLASRSDSSKQRMSSSLTVERKSVYILSCPGCGMSPSADVVPGPLTFRMIDRVVSSMNSTRTCVTPPREPVWLSAVSYSPSLAFRRGIVVVPVRPRTRVTLTSLTGTFAESMVTGLEVVGSSLGVV